MSEVETSNSLTGDGAQNASISRQRIHPRAKPYFNGVESSFEIWELKFLSYLRLCGLHKTLQNSSSINEEENAEVFAELMQCLDDRSINLVIRDARDDGRKALDILSKHYRPKGKARVITLYTELTSLRKEKSESVTDYLVKAETITAALREADEVISDSLLIAMILKGLPESFFTIFSYNQRQTKTTVFRLQNCSEKF